MPECQLRLAERQAQLRVQEEDLLGKTGGRLRAQGEQAGRQLRSLREDRLLDSQTHKE
jgi:hypothetical protein